MTGEPQRQVSNRSQLIKEEPPDGLSVENEGSRIVFTPRPEGHAAVLVISKYVFDEEEAEGVLQRLRQASALPLTVGGLAELVPAAAGAVADLVVGDIVLTARDSGEGAFFVAAQEADQGTHPQLVLLPSGLFGHDFCLPEAAWEVHEHLGLEEYYDLSNRGAHPTLQRLMSFQPNRTPCNLGGYLGGRQLFGGYGSEVHACVVPLGSPQYRLVEASRPANGGPWLLVYFHEDFFDVYEEELGPDSAACLPDGTVVDQLLWVPGPFYQEEITTIERAPKHPLMRVATVLGMLAVTSCLLIRAR